MDDHTSRYDGRFCSSAYRSTRSISREPVPLPCSAGCTPTSTTCRNGPCACTRVDTRITSADVHPHRPRYVSRLSLGPNPRARGLNCCRCWCCGAFCCQQLPLAPAGSRAALRPGSRRKRQGHATWQAAPRPAAASGPATCSPASRPAAEDNAISRAWQSQWAAGLEQMQTQNLAMVKACGASEQAPQPACIPWQSAGDCCDHSQAGDGEPC